MAGSFFRPNLSHKPAVDHAYMRFRSYGLARWVVDIVILCLTIPILARNPKHNALIAAAYAVGAAGLDTILFIPLAGPRSPSDARPAKWVAPALGFTQAALVPAAALLIRVYVHRDGRYHSRRALDASTASLDKRIYIGHNTLSGSENERLALVAGCFCIGAIVAGIIQLFYIGKIHAEARDKKMMDGGPVEIME